MPEGQSHITRELLNHQRISKGASHQGHRAKTRRTLYATLRMHPQHPPANTKGAGETGCPSIHQPAPRLGGHAVVRGTTIPRSFSSPPSLKRDAVRSGDSRGDSWVTYTPCGLRDWDGHVGCAVGGGTQPSLCLGIVYCPGSCLLGEPSPKAV